MSREKVNNNRKRLLKERGSIKLKKAGVRSLGVRGYENLYEGIYDDLYKTKR